MISEDWFILKLKLTTQSVEKDLTLSIDKVTWKQFIQQALFKNHGVFGQGVEYDILRTTIHRYEEKTENIGYVKVSKMDVANLINAVNIYINTKLIEDSELVCVVVQKTDDLAAIEIESDENLWRQKLIENWEE
ncbi:hypothetical protein QEN19_001689 [Hanseniaspora menglaensis]